MSITVDELRVGKKGLESEIMELIKNFTDDYGVHVVKIELYTHIHESIGSLERIYDYTDLIVKLDEDLQ